MGSRQQCVVLRPLLFVYLPVTGQTRFLELSLASAKVRFRHPQVPDPMAHVVPAAAWTGQAGSKG